MTSQHLKFLMTPAQHRQWAANARRRNRPDLAQHHELRRQRLDAFGLKRELLAAGIRIRAGIHNKAPRTTRRPASVILTRATSIGLPAATMRSTCADASPAWISSTSRLSRKSVREQKADRVDPTRVRRRAVAIRITAALCRQ
jgi:hypothetical protein